MDYDSITCEVDIEFNDLLSEYYGSSKITSYNGYFITSMYRVANETLKKMKFVTDGDKFDGDYCERIRVVGKMWVTICYVENDTIKINLTNLFAYVAFTDISYIFLWLIDFIKFRNCYVVKYYIIVPNSHEDVSMSMYYDDDNDEILNFLLNLRLYFSYDYGSNMMNIACLMVEDNISLRDVATILNCGNLSMRDVLITIIRSLIGIDYDVTKIRNFVTLYDEILMELNVYDELSNYLI